MFEISELKAKKLPELQELAKQLNVPKYRSFKKLDLVYQILDYQAANPQAVKEISKDYCYFMKIINQEEVYHARISTTATFYRIKFRRIYDYQWWLQ